MERTMAPDLGLYTSTTHCPGPLDVTFSEGTWSWHGDKLCSPYVLLADSFKGNKCSIIALTSAGNLGKFQRLFLVDAGTTQVDGVSVPLYGANINYVDLVLTTTRTVRSVKEACPPSFSTHYDEIYEYAANTALCKYYFVRDGSTGRPAIPQARSFNRYAHLDTGPSMGPFVDVVFAELLVRDICRVRGCPSRPCGTARTSRPKLLTTDPQTWLDAQDAGCLNDYFGVFGAHPNPVDLCVEIKNGLIRPLLPSDLDDPQAKAFASTDPIEAARARKVAKASAPATPPTQRPHDDMLRGPTPPPGASFFPRDSKDSNMGSPGTHTARIPFDQPCDKMWSPQPTSTSTAATASNRLG